MKLPRDLGNLLPAHSQLRVGTLGAILSEVADHFGISRADLLNQLFT